MFTVFDVNSIDYIKVSSDEDYPHIKVYLKHREEGILITPEDECYEAYLQQAEKLKTTVIKPN